MILLQLMLVQKTSCVKRSWGVIIYFGCGPNGLRHVISWIAFSAYIPTTFLSTC